ncbi:hypothetical protein [Bradyrhizobium cenepequi]|uniref:hypothetical protein n=1 Tax=Bradyrhizobium cenepequi TaxID=2821403 RepID=UPI001CE2F910|nr:hypothetical protein [Bradyrhizobium cenepequi]MCA6105754.1 hypothetical protein [Bradyrhizobium cenepequi]
MRATWSVTGEPCPLRSAPANTSTSIGTSPVVQGLPAAIAGTSLSADNTRVSISGSVATISFEGSDDSITLQLGPYSPATLAFADGTSLTVAAEGRIARTPYSASA